MVKIYTSDYQTIDRIDIEDEDKELILSLYMRSRYKRTYNLVELRNNKARINKIKDVFLLHVFIALLKEKGVKYEIIGN